VNLLKTSLILFAAITSLNGWAHNIPPEVHSFVNTRKQCDHFRSEPRDIGDDAEVKERREFLLKMTKRYCAGTDRRLSVLRNKYRNNRQVLTILDEFDDAIELPDKK